MNPEDSDWLTADLSPPLEPYDWGEIDPDTLGKPIHFEVGVGFIVEGEKDF